MKIDVLITNHDYNNAQNSYQKKKKIVKKRKRKEKTPPGKDNVTCHS